MAGMSPSGPSGVPGRSGSDNGLALVALVSGVLSIVLVFVPPLAFIGILLSLVALGTGIAGLRRAGRLGGAGRGMAIAGLVTGGITAAILVFGAFLLLGSDEGQELLDEAQSEIEQQQGGG